MQQSIQKRCEFRSIAHISAGDVPGDMIQIKTRRNLCGALVRIALIVFRL